MGVSLGDPLVLLQRPALAGLRLQWFTRNFITGILTAYTIRAKRNPELCTFRINAFHLEINPLFVHFQFESDSSSGCILLLYSVILSRSIRK